MTFFHHIQRCNRFDLARFRPLRVAGGIYGWVRADVARVLADYPDLMAVADDHVALQPNLADFEARTAAFDRLADSLVARGVVAKRRDELYPLRRRWGEPAIAALDRGIVPALGVRAFGIHVNGYVPGDDGPQVITAVRAGDKSVAPGAYDNLVAGGQPYGLSLWTNLLKEAEEEAGLSAEVAGRARPVSAISYCLETAEGLKPDTMFIYDLPLPAEARVAPNDGEVSHFFTTGPGWLAETVAGSSHAFKFNCNLVVIDFLLRHGYLDPESESYLALLQGLRYPVGQLFQGGPASLPAVPVLPQPDGG